MENILWEISEGNRRNSYRDGRVWEKILWNGLPIHENSLLRTSPGGKAAGGKEGRDLLLLGAGLHILNARDAAALSCVLRVGRARESPRVSGVGGWREERGVMGE